MQLLVRTTLRLYPQLKRSAEEKALTNNVSLQDIFNRALEEYLTREAKKKAKKILFKTYDIGKPLDHLRRSDYYAKPTTQ